jgi:hypothetical protein
MRTVLRGAFGNSLLVTLERRGALSTEIHRPTTRLMHSCFELTGQDWRVFESLLRRS